MKKTILIFGDSNTWGYRPDNTHDTPSVRWEDDERWGGVLQLNLGDKYKVIVDGQNGRTTVWDDPIEENRCGKNHLLPSMMAHSPLDLLVIMLGTNDLKVRYSATAQDIADGAGLLVQKAKALPHLFTNQNPEILLICPPNLGALSKTPFGEIFTDAEEKSQRLPEFFKQTASLNNVHYLNSADFIKSSEIDAVHLEADQHKILGEMVAEKVKKIL